ncbi:unnamed protein product [Adineta steineri]|uniref:Uncharacterized protein n=1 Tax=Adineta steineri TaxID=433720 RepID=A0A815IXC0_9BILA|nr:unnamed protein product [Adineta steineri]
MLFGKILILFFLLHCVNLQLQINFYQTNWINEDHDFEHDCLNIVPYTREESNDRQMMSYCMSEWPSIFPIKDNNFDKKLTFFELSQQHVTSEQLYLWSAPIDLIEQYQYYLNRQSYFDSTSSLANQVFYNCTLPYFGSKCQYMFNNYNYNYSSLNEIISNYYEYNRYQPTLFTCYIHLECNRGPSPSCLDWTEICDGKFDCLDSRIDEEHCWQLEIHQCNDDEFQCSYGQCVPKTFVQDASMIPDCLDQSDKTTRSIRNPSTLFVMDIKEPTFMYEDISCARTNRFVYSLRLLTSSCVLSREDLLSHAMLSIKPNLITDECWAAFRCVIQMPIPSKEFCLILCNNEVCDSIIDKMCPDMIYISTYPFFHDRFYVVYNKSRLKDAIYMPKPTYVCYDNEFLDVPNDTKRLFIFNNKTCRRYDDSITGNVGFFEPKWIQLSINLILKWLHKTTTLTYNNPVFCDRSIMYQCINSSKCIMKTRLFDNIADCYYHDDEDPSTFNNTDLQQLQNIFRCKTIEEYFPTYFVNDTDCDCRTPGDSYCADENSAESYFRKTISFQTICDKEIHLMPQIFGDTETDETNCDQWPLMHIYNRCDGFWHIPDGSDELNCDLSLSLLNCSENEHVCVSSKTDELICLSIEHVNDNINDCIGAADERKICRQNQLGSKDAKLFACNNTKYEKNSTCLPGDYLCNGENDCSNNEDERICKGNDILSSSLDKGICAYNYELYGSDIAKALCRLFVNNGKRSTRYFTLDQSQNSLGHYSEDGETPLLIYQIQEIPRNIYNYQQRCHRGLDVQIFLDKQKNLTKNVCLCPPSFYGDICQYQNQRISLTLQFRDTTNSTQILYNIIITLIDNSNERIIQSSQQFNYYFKKHCQKKFHFYLLYSTRPKDSTKEYSIHLDFYDKLTLDYHGSIIKSVNYSFLPVQRLAFHLEFPYNYENISNCLDKQCIHGKCIKYFHEPNNKRFCQCNEGWSGQYCTIKHTCLCSSQSLCIGKLANNQSLCVCPLNRMGPQCLIDNQLCQSNQICHYRGRCILIDEYETPENKFLCICSKDFYGDRCELSRTRLIISVDKNFHLSSSIFIHFIEIKTNDFPIRTTTFKNIRLQQDSLIIYWSLPFHIAFIELLNKSYYLITTQKIYKQSAIIHTSLNLFNRCLDIKELFNETFFNYTLLYRIKFYHMPCQMNALLSCFYDEQRFCLCQQINQQRVANCFDFDPYTESNCSSQYHCENGGKCFQEDSKCPKYFHCQCPVCYYGTRCQLNTDGFSLSLDAILGYHIYPNINIFNQPSAVLTSSILSTIILIMGIINSILSLITFKNKKTHDSACGIYLLCTSIITLLLIIIFTFKFWILIMAQIGSIQNELFLNIQCHSVDFLLKFCLTMDQWLTTFVSVERAYITIKGIGFNNNKRKSLTKWIILGLILITIVTNVHDPIYRRLHTEEDDEDIRIWCIVKYPPVIDIVNSVMNIFHFIAPFIINLTSAIIIIIINARQRAKLKTKQKYIKILQEQIQQHKSLLIGPFVLIIFSISRVIISFASGCMKSMTDSWLFLFGYFMSLIPPLLTFVLFVLPSTTYKQAFKKAISRYRNIFRRQ